jgi:hypothetical protein
MDKFSLKRTIQCAKCPWKVDTNPHEIPHGYDVEKHRDLSCTIADNPLNFTQKTLHAMACHHSESGDEEYCIGWLHNQLGVGNNIMLRMKMMYCENIRDMKTIGEQHERFEDTLP